MPLDLYLLRHGETESSRMDTFCGDLDPPLTAEGAQMAQAFADKYASLTWQAIFVSPMQRTIATAQPFCQATGLTMQLRDGLKEVSFGAWEDQTKPHVEATYREDYMQWLTEPAWNPPTGGETAVQVASRSALVIAEIQEKYPQGNVLVVAHKSTLRIVLCNLLGIDLGRYRDRIHLPVASVSLVRFDIYGPLLVKHGDRSHLPTDLEDRPGT